MATIRNKNGQQKNNQLLKFCKSKATETCSIYSMDNNKASNPHQLVVAKNRIYTTNLAYCTFNVKSPLILRQPLRVVGKLDPSPALLDICPTRFGHDGFTTMMSSNPAVRTADPLLHQAIYHGPTVCTEGRVIKLSRLELVRDGLLHKPHQECVNARCTFLLSQTRLRLPVPREG